MLGKTTNHAMHNDNECSQRVARKSISFILQNLKYLDNVRNGSTYKERIISMAEQRENFTDKQLSYIDTIYEKVMKGFGLPSFSSTFKPKKKFV